MDLPGGGDTIMRQVTARNATLGQQKLIQDTEMGFVDTSLLFSQLRETV